MKLLFLFLFVGIVSSSVTMAQGDSLPCEAFDADCVKCLEHCFFLLFEGGWTFCVKTRGEIRGRPIALLTPHAFAGCSRMPPPAPPSPTLPTLKPPAVSTTTTTTTTEAVPHLTQPSNTFQNVALGVGVGLVLIIISAVVVFKFGLPRAREWREQRNRRNRHYTTYLQDKRRQRENQMVEMDFLPSSVTRPQTPSSSSSTSIFNKNFAFKADFPLEEPPPSSLTAAAADAAAFFAGVEPPPPPAKDEESSGAEEITLPSDAIKAFMWQQRFGEWDGVGTSTPSLNPPPPLKLKRSKRLAEKQAKQESLL